MLARNPPSVLDTSRILQRLSLLELGLMSMEIIFLKLEHAFRELVVCCIVRLIYVWDLCELFSGLNRPIVSFFLELFVETGEVKLAVLHDLALPALWHGQLEATQACLLCERQIFE